MTLAQLRALLALARGPAVERLKDRTPEGVARAYLPHTIRASHMYRMAEHAEPRRRWVDVVLNDAVRSTWDTGAPHLNQIQASGQKMLLAYDLITPETGASDPGTVNAVKVALALALGLDPGPMGCAVSWRYGAWGWVLRGAGSSYIMSATTEEPDAIKALVLAVEHVLGAT